MVIRNYEIPEDIAQRVPQFYVPGMEEELTELAFISRNEEGRNPRINYRIPTIANTVVQLTLDPQRPLIEYIDISAPETQIDNIEGIVAKVLQIDLKPLRR